MPRNAGAVEGNWESYPSRPDMVYLTEAYAPFFAMMAEGDGRPVMLEIQTDKIDQSRLYPDEDFIAQDLREKTGMPLDRLHQEVRENLLAYQQYAAESLRFMGNAAYLGSIPASAITRYCIVEHERQPHSCMAACDPSISPLNYRFCGGKYRSLTSWFFGDRPDWNLGYGDNERLFAHIDQVNPGDGDRLRESFANRDGITICSVRQTPCQKK